MQLHIAICDDDRTEIDYLKALVSRWADERGLAARIGGFVSAESFLFAYEEDKSFDILLLDIQMKAMDGVALAKRIRKDNEALQIVFITGYPDFMAEGYEVSALHYLIKPVDGDKLTPVLDRARKNLNRTEKSLLFTAGGESVRVPVGEIMVCESVGHTTAVTAKSGVYEVRLPLSELQNELDDGFVRCHRSYLVGIRHIGRITKTDVILDDGRTVPLSRQLYDAVNRAFIRYFREAP